MDYISYGLLVTVVVMAVITDQKNYKIKNGYLVIGSLSGLILNSVILGYKGFVSSFLGLIIPIIILFILFALRMLGAGDIKLFATIGAIMGPYFVISVMLYAFVIGGIMAFFIMLKKKLLFQRLKYFVEYIMATLKSRKIVAYYDVASEGYQYVMHFSYAIGLGALVKILLNFWF